MKFVQKKHQTAGNNNSYDPTFAPLTAWKGNYEENFKKFGEVDS